MFFACWSAKGGSGATVVACALALALARRPDADVLLVDLAGDVPAVLGLAASGEAGVIDWLSAPASDRPSLSSFERPVLGGLRLLPLGGDQRPASLGEAPLLAALASEARPVVVDCGSAPVTSALGQEIAACAGQSLLVVRNCYLSLRHAVQAPIRPSGLVVVSEPGRPIAAGQVAEILGVPLVAVVPYEPAVARLVDAGLLANRLPLSLSAPMAGLTV